VRSRFDKVTLRGFKTIKELKDFEPGPLTVLIGPNGAGKSNFLSFFRLLSWALAPPGGLQEYVAKLGGASALLHDGPERTSFLEADLKLVAEEGANEYYFRLAHASGDTLVFAEERYRLQRLGFLTPKWWRFDAGNKEARLIGAAERGEKTPKTIHNLLQKVIFHHFQNTSETARIRSKWPVEDGRWLKEDAANLAPFLLRLQSQQPRYYLRIVETVRLILPFFAGFEFQPEYGSVLLQWREKGSDRIFHAGQAADGMLRILALVALLQQPEFDLPDVLILDEPELGLHPFAIEVIAGLIRAASKHVQVMVATQSVSLIDRFDPGDIVVVDRRGRESQFHRLGEADLKEWLDTYTLSELWEKNVIGGRP
jgi:predicted ATPase